MDPEHCTEKGYNKQFNMPEAEGVYKNSLLKFNSEVTRSLQVLIHLFTTRIPITDHCLVKPLLLEEQSVDHSPRSYGYSLPV